MPRDTGRFHRKEAASHLTLQPPPSNTYWNAICFSAAKHMYSISINTRKGTLNAGFQSSQSVKTHFPSLNEELHYNFGQHYDTDDPSPPLPSQLNSRSSHMKHESFKTSSAAGWWRSGVNGVSPLPVAPCCASHSPASLQSHGSAANISGMLIPILLWGPERHWN